MTTAADLHVFRATGPSTRVEVLELNQSHLDEQHEFPEGMFVTNGKIHVLVDGKAIAVSAGGMLIVKDGEKDHVARWRIKKSD